MHRKSRALLLIAAALLLLTAAFADTAKAQEAGTWEELEAALAKGGSVTLTADVEGSTQLYAAPGDTELDLNNFTITYAALKRSSTLKNRSASQTKIQKAAAKSSRTK